MDRLIRFGMLLAASIMACVSGCDKNGLANGSGAGGNVPGARRPAPVVTLTWSGFDGASANDPNNAIYILGGKQAGRGREGFADVLRQVEGLPSGSELLIYPDRRILAYLVPTGRELYGPTRIPDTVRFRRAPMLAEALRQTAAKRGIVVWYLAGPPGKTYESSLGGDYRMRGE